MNKLQKIKVIITGICVALSVAVIGHAGEILLKQPTADIGLIYWIYIGIGFFFIFGIVIAVLKNNLNHRKNTLFLLSLLFAATSVCFLLFYQPFFTCLQKGGYWDKEQKCTYISKSE